jgi:hypothetical protein
MPRSNSPVRAVAAVGGGPPPRRAGPGLAAAARAQTFAPITNGQFGSNSQTYAGTGTIRYMW